MDRLKEELFCFLLFMHLTLDVYAFNLRFCWFNDV